ncbi:MAG TPA: ROK family protein [Saprospiraceae bacterium]|nr:ROK family protein [Saprospiraceae bacterium]
MENKAVIGVDLGATKVRAGKIVDGTIISDSYLRISAKAEDPFAIINEVISSIRAVHDSSIHAIGIGVPSVVDAIAGIVYDVQNIPSWKEVHLKAALEHEFQLPVSINNDANCFALGEHRFGLGQSYDNMIGLIIGTGVAGGIIINHQLYVGHNCGAGEFGMMPYLDHYYEYYCSGQFFERWYHLPGEEVTQLAEKGDQNALKIFNEYGRHLGNAIKAILYAYDPACIILGGSVSKSFRFFEVALRQQLNEFVYPKSIRRLKIEVSRNPDIPVLGAGALCE